MTHTLRRRIATAALALPLLLASCANDQPVPKMPQASTPTTAATETVTEPEGPIEPTLPPEAKGTGIKAAEAFVRHYIAVVDYSRQVMDPGFIRRISSPTCTGCNGLGDLLAKVSSNDGRITGGDQAVESIRAEELGLPGAGEAYRATAMVQTTEQTISQSGVDGLDGVRKPERLHYGFVLLRNGSEWKVSEWDIL